MALRCVFLLVALFVCGCTTVEHAVVWPKYKDEVRDLDRAVLEGALTQAEADKAKAWLKDRSKNEPIVIYGKFGALR